MKNVHPAPGAGIQTHILLNMRFLPKPLDQGSRPNKAKGYYLLKSTYSEKGDSRYSVRIRLGWKYFCLIDDCFWENWTTIHQFSTFSEANKYFCTFLFVFWLFLTIFDPPSKINLNVHPKVQASPKKGSNIIFDQFYTLFSQHMTHEKKHPVMKKRTKYSKVIMCNNIKYDS